MRKCQYCDKDELCGVGVDNTPVCEDHFNEYLKRKRHEAEEVLNKIEEDLSEIEEAINKLREDPYDTTAGQERRAR